MAACAQAVRRRTMLAQLRQGQLDCGSALAEVHEVLRRWRRGYQRRELKRYAMVTRLADGAGHLGLKGSAERHFKIEAQCGDTGSEVGMVVWLVTQRSQGYDEFD